MKNLSPAYAWSMCILMTAISITGCSKNESVRNIRPASADTLAIYKNQAYGDHDQQTMDIYLPAGRSTAKTRSIIFIHGGAWTGGDKDEFSGTIDSLMKQKTPYACFSLNYRLAGVGSNQYPAAEQDVQRALDYIWQNSERFQISTTAVLLGTSAGAHLSVLHAYKHNQDAHIKAVVSLYGVYDLTTLFAQTAPAIQILLTNFMGGMPAQKPEEYKQASPINYVSAQSVPVLVMYGTADEIAPPAQAQEFTTKLQATGVAYQQVSYTGGHGIPAANAADAWNRTLSFINKYLAGQ